MEPVQAQAAEQEGDAILVTTVKRGDACAFDKLVSHHQRKALGLAHAVTKNQHDAQDANK
jgi:hypothetical protein